MSRVFGVVLVCSVSHAGSLSHNAAIPGNQEFFLRFLLACDSFRFLSVLHRALGAELLRQLSGPEGSQAPGDVSTPCVHLARLRLLAKFLGVLTFCPNWTSVDEAVSTLE
jgi:hypothetical protein